MKKQKKLQNSKMAANAKKEQKKKAKNEKEGQ